MKTLTFNTFLAITNAAFLTLHNKGEVMRHTLDLDTVEYKCSTHDEYHLGICPRCEPPKKRTYSQHSLLRLLMGIALVLTVSGAAVALLP